MYQMIMTKYSPPNEIVYHVLSILLATRAAMEKSCPQCGIKWNCMSKLSKAIKALPVCVHFKEYFWGKQNVLVSQFNLWLTNKPETFPPLEFNVTCIEE